jgi:hypothetical protein
MSIATAGFFDFAAGFFGAGAFFCFFAAPDSDSSSLAARFLDAAVAFFAAAGFLGAAAFFGAAFLGLA